MILMDSMGESRNNGWCVYVLKCRKNYLYVGITNDFDARMKAHANGTGSKFVRAWRPFELVKVLSCKDGREARLKRMKRDKKIEALGLKVFNV